MISDVEITVQEQNRERHMHLTAATIIDRQTLHNLSLSIGESRLDNIKESRVIVPPHFLNEMVVTR